MSEEKLDLRKRLDEAVRELRKLGHQVGPQTNSMVGYAYGAGETALRLGDEETARQKLDWLQREVERRQEFRAEHEVVGVRGSLARMEFRLRHATQFRFPYWEDDEVWAYYVEERRPGQWVITDVSGIKVWTRDGKWREREWRDCEFWSLDDALPLALGLADEERARIQARVDRGQQYPGLRLKDE